jgi:hypothetical protein
MKTSHDFVGSHWAPKGSYGKPVANCPGEGSNKMSGAPGSYIPAMKKSGRGAPKSGPVMRNSPGMGSGHQSNKPVGGKKGYMGKSGMIRMGNND